MDRVFEAEEEFARQFVFVKGEKTVVNLAIFRHLTGIHFENILNVFKLNQSSSDVVLKSVNPIEKPIEAVSNINLEELWLLWWIVRQGP